MQACNEKVYVDRYFIRNKSWINNLFFSCLGIGDFDDIQRSTGWAYDNYMGVTGLSAIHFLILGKSKISLT